MRVNQHGKRKQKEIVEAVGEVYAWGAMGVTIVAERPDDPNIKIFVELSSEEIGNIYRAHLNAVAEVKARMKKFKEEQL